MGEEAAIDDDDEGKKKAEKRVQKRKNDSQQELASQNKRKKHLESLEDDSSDYGRRVPSPEVHLTTVYEQFVQYVTLYVTGRSTFPPRKNSAIPRKNSALSSSSQEDLCYSTGLKKLS